MKRISSALERMVRDALAGITGRSPPRTVLVPRDGVPLFYRTYLAPAPGDEPGLFLHRIVSSDSAALHNHPWKWAMSFILVGRYKETRAFAEVKDGRAKLGATTTRTYEAGECNFLRVADFHRLEILTPEVWTLFVHGPRVGSWGFVKSPTATTRGRWWPIRVQERRTRDGAK